MKKRLFISLITAILLFSLVLTSCQPGGVSQALYDQVAAQVKDAQAKLAEAQKTLGDLQEQKSAIDKELAAAKLAVTDLQKQLAALKDQASLIGATPAETAAKIVKNYHDTHVYSTYDYFICGDMASEVWNMLKAQNISALIVVGKVDATITDILQSDHGWVLASVGEWLALETTGGVAVKKSENPLYYRGWAFNSPADLKANNDYVKEHNLRVTFRNQLNNEANKALAAGNDALYAKLVELRTAQETEILGLKDKIKELATPISY